MKVENAGVLITGGASGIGKAVAKHLTALGAKVCILDITEATHQVAQSIGCTGMIVNVTHAQAVETAIHQLPFPLSIVVNCAGIAPAQRMVSTDGTVNTDWFASVININLIGTFHVMQAGAMHMINTPSQNGTERGVIINTASIAAWEGQIGQIAYSASKAGITGMTLPAARELARFGIRVMAIAPGFFDTPLLETMPEKVKDALLAQTVFPHRLGNPHEFATLVEHIIMNPMLNGEVIRLDGAVRMR